MRTALAFLAAYLLGAIPFGLVIAGTRGIDLRKFGSGNIGATNAMRALGKPLGLLVFLLDAAKGFAPACLGLRGIAGLPASPGWGLGLGAAAVLGHTFPVWLRFKGGKGVATACGVWLAVAPLPCLIALGVFVLALVLTRYVSLASTLAAFALPLALKIQAESPDGMVMAAAAMALLIAVRHRGNFVRIAAGVEPRLGQGRKENP